MDNLEERWTLEGAKETFAAYMLEATKNGRHLGLSFAIADHDNVHFWNHGYRSTDRLEESSEHHYLRLDQSVRYSPRSSSRA